MDIVSDFLDGINILIDTNLKNRSFAEIIDGTIIKKNDDNTYKVQINNEYYDMWVYIARELQPYDLVKIVKQDGSLNNAFIL